MSYKLKDATDKYKKQDETYFGILKGSTILLCKDSRLDVKDLKQTTLKDDLEAFGGRMWVDDKTLETIGQNAGANVMTQSAGETARKFTNKGLVVADTSIFSRYLSDRNGIDFPKWIIFDPDHATFDHAEDVVGEVIDLTNKHVDLIKGKFFVMTGKGFETRHEITKKIKAAGGLTFGAVNSNTDYLVCDDISSSTTKAQKAKALGVTVISYGQLYKKMGIPGY
jgi:NAD-dependent DNA ligase